MNTRPAKADKTCPGCGVVDPKALCVGVYDRAQNKHVRVWICHDTKASRQTINPECLAAAKAMHDPSQDHQTERTSDV